MARISSIMSISLPPGLLTTSKKIARQQNMTQSELIRTALRRYVEELQMDRAVRIAEQELMQGKAKQLGTGGLASLMS